MFHPVAGAFLVTEESYRRQRIAQGFRPSRRARRLAAAAEIAARTELSPTGRRLPAQRAHAQVDSTSGHEQHAA